MSRTIESVLKQYRPLLSRAEDCVVNSDLTAGTLDEDLDIELLTEWSDEEISIYLNREYSIKLCAHLCAQFLVHPDELKEAMTPLAHELDAIADQMGIDVNFDDVSS